MESDWDCFIRYLDEESAASIVLDLNAHKRERQHLPRVSKASIRLKSPNRDGLSSANESGKLEGAEDAFEDYIRGTEHGCYVGRVTFSGRRIFYGYVPESIPVGKSGRALGEYEADFETEDDAEWGAFQKELYPTDEELRCIMNRRVVDNLQKHGDDLTRPRETDHWVYFPNPGDAVGFRTAAREKGYKLRQESVVQGRIKVQIYKVENVDQESIDASTLVLARLAKAHRGTYDGWETFVVKPSSSER